MISTKGSAVISISAARESPKRALRSIIENHGYFADVHIVKHGYNSQEVLYNGYETDIRLLTELKLAPQWHSSLDTSKLATRAIVRIEPDVSVADGALADLFKDMIEHGGSYDFFGVSNELILRPPKNGFSLDFLAYGYLLVITVLDALRSLVSLWQYHKTSDLRATLVSVTFPNRVRVPTPNWFRWWFLTRIYPSRNGGTACQQVPKRGAGWNFVARYIKTHNHMGIGVYWILFLILYVAVFGLPFWNLFVHPNSTIGLYIYRDLTSSIWIAANLVHLGIVGLLSLPRLNVPLMGLLLLLYPLYLTTAPFVFLYARVFHSVGVGWRRPPAVLKKK